MTDTDRRILKFAFLSSLILMVIAIALVARLVSEVFQQVKALIG